MVHILERVQRPAETPDGALPVKQQRGGRTRDRLLAAGRRLVARRDFDSISVAEIADAAGCSVGSFYQRFRNKDAFFGALVAHYVADARATTVALFEEFDDDRLIAQLVLATAKRFRTNAGLIRATIRKRMESPVVWEPIRRQGYFAADSFIAWRTARRGRPMTADETTATRFAFQMLYGTLNNAIINQPGPIDLRDAEFVVQLERAFRLALLYSAKPPKIEP